MTTTTTSYYDRPDVPTFSQVASYFGICVWLVPFSLFVSLSANDNVLPTMGSSEPPRSAGGGGGGGGNKRQGLVKAAVDGVLGVIGEVSGSSSGKRDM